MANNVSTTCNTDYTKLFIGGVMNCGQACIGQTRILAPRSRYDEIVDKIAGAVSAMPVAPPDDLRGEKRLTAVRLHASSLILRRAPRTVAA